MPTTISSVPVEINAPVEKVWSILAKIEDYPRWNPFTYRVDSTLELGSQALLYVRMSDKLKLTRDEIVTSFAPNKELAWRARGIRWLLAANRVQRLEVIDEQHTRYTTHETFSGLLRPLVIFLMGKMVENGFNGVAHALKAYAETGAPSAG
ncbi:MAG: SRPBCC domain-containing protein [Anaerolineae bacterium]